MSYNLPELSHLITIVKEAGKITQSYFNKQLNVSEKADNQGIVTDADLASEKAIIEFISRHFSGHAILAEESGVHGLLLEDSKPLWVIDPVDGTTNFSKANPYYCVSIGFGRATKTHYEPLLGVVYQPATDFLFSAEKGKGAFLNGERILPMPQTTPHLSCVCTGFASAKGDKLKQVTNSIYEMQNIFLGTRINGAAALDLANTARGTFQGFYERGLAPWDMAAGLLLVQESGGWVTNFQGEPFNLMRDREIIACHPSIYDKLKEAVQKSFLKA